MATIHMTESDAGRKFESLMAYLRAGEEVMLESQVFPVIAIRASTPPLRLISDCIALAKKHEAETGLAPTLDADFARDMQDVLRNRKPSLPIVWDE